MSNLITQFAVPTLNGDNYAIVRKMLIGVPVHSAKASLFFGTDGKSGTADPSRDNAPYRTHDFGSHEFTVGGEPTLWTAFYAVSGDEDTYADCRSVIPCVYEWCSGHDLYESGEDWDSLSHYSDDHAVWPDDDERRTVAGTLDSAICTRAHKTDGARLVVYLKFEGDLTVGDGTDGGGYTGSAHQLLADLGDAKTLVELFIKEARVRQAEVSQ